MSAQHRPSFLLHAARQLADRPVRERGEAGGLEQFGDPRAALVSALAEQLGEKVEVLVDAERGVEILAQALRHVGDAMVAGLSVPAVGNVAAQRLYRSGLQSAYAGDQAQQGRFADAVRPDQADHAAGRNVERDIVERDRFTITLGDARDAADGSVGVVHCGSLTCRLAGQSEALAPRR